jgi:hypothetical protein
MIKVMSDVSLKFCEVTEAEAREADEARVA